MRSVPAVPDLLSQRQARSAYIDSERTIQAFLQADLVDELTVSAAPVLLGGGIRLFDSPGGEVRLRLRGAHRTLEE